MTAKSTYAGTKPCGTSAAAGRHRYYGEPLCDACRLAENSRMRRQRRGLNPKVRAPRHGTVSGYRNLHPNEKACDACLEAMAEYNRNWRAGKRRSDQSETPLQVLVVDIVETFGYAMTADEIVQHVNRIRPGVHDSSIRKALYRSSLTNGADWRGDVLWSTT